jgi:hypothetical protein
MIRVHRPALKIGPAFKNNQLAIGATRTKRSPEEWPFMAGVRSVEMSTSAVCL